MAVPALSRAISEPARYRSLYLRILEKLLLLTVPTGVFLLAGVDWLVELVLGDQWGEATWFFMALGISVLVQPLANTTGWLFISQTVPTT